MNVDLGTAIDEPRIHHQLFPNFIQFESQISETIFPQKVKIEQVLLIISIILLNFKDLVSGLLAKNQNIECEEFGLSAVEGIARLENGELMAVCDYRKGGDVSGF